MKRFHNLFMALCVSMLSFTASAEWYNEITFTVSSNVETPVKVRYDGRTYTVYSSLTINTTGNTYTPSATDRNGNSLKYETSFRTVQKGSDKYHYNTYTFYSRDSYSSSRGSSNSSGNPGGYNSGYSSGNSYSDAGAALGRELAHATVTRSLDEEGAYPGLHAQAGMSKGFGEFVRLRIAAGGFQVYGGVGKDWLFNGDNKDKFLWHAGLGGYYSLGEDRSRWGDVAFGLTVAENAAWENLSLTLDLGFTYWFGRWRRVGAFAGTGIGWGDIKDLGKSGHHTKLAWNVEIGLAFRLAHF